MAEHLLFHVFLLLVTSLVTVSANDVVNLTVGEDTVLPCGGPEGRVVALQWTKSKRSILVYRDGRVEKTQDEQFRDRVQLQDLESGNRSLSIKNVTEGDSGIYTCEFLVQTPNRPKRAVPEEDFSRSIQLFVRPKVKNPAQKPHTAVNEDEATHADGGGAAEQNRSHLTAVTAVTAVIVVSSVVGILFWKRDRIKPWQRVEQPHTLA